MDQIQIDRLTLRAPAISEGESRRLLALVLRGLADAQLPESAASRVSGLTIALEARPQEQLEPLSRRIVAELLTRLTSSS